MTLSTPSRLSDVTTLVRLPNSLMIGLAVIIGETIAVGALPSPDKALFGFLTASLMMAGTMVMNDIYDAPIDKVNNPDRPIASGRVKTRQAWSFAVIFSTASIVSSLLLGVWTLLTAIVALALMIYYNIHGKKIGLLGNTVVSFNIALPFFFGGLAVGSLKPLLLTFSALAFLANLGREVAKGIPDAQGDRQLGVRTLAVSQGPRTAGLVAGVLFFTAVALSLTPPLLGQVTILYFPGIVLADAGLVYSAIRLLYNPSPQPVKKLKTWVLIWMLMGLVGFLLGGLSP